ncbi:IclR family transcriptional regulator [Streptomyces sp. CB01635]|uniref:IclR family transcriptional regulator n=1 Tax=Streptomyces sp. CB01635 TaxID=2020326 RepID=UPI000C2723DE|nr:IclR family transcriptional regulator [Streptomyces sp. CB01635]PJN11980.1 IclR family transcriptional regulator [Streptomyces sp. CB01635]
MNEANAPRSVRSQGHGLRRDVDLLEALGSPEAHRTGGLGVVRIAQLVGRDKSQVSRALKALADEGIVERDPDSLEYRLGWRLFSLVARTSESRVVRVAGPVMHRLAADLEETTHLCVLHDREVRTLLSVSGHSYRLREWEGRGCSAWITSAGPVLLEGASPDELYVRFGATEEVSVPDLWSRIRRAEAEGFAREVEEFEPGLVGVSAAVRDFRGRVVAALNVTAPAERFAARLDHAGRAAAAAAAKVSAQLGWEPRQ